MSNALYYQTSSADGSNPTFNGNNPSNGNNPISNGRLPKRVPMACVKCRDRKIKCIPGAPPNHPCTRCRDQNQECVYISVAEQTQQRIQTSPEPTDFYPPYEPPPSSPHYTQSPPSMVPIYSHPHHPPPNQSYPVPVYQNADHHNAASNGPSPPSNVSPVSQTTSYAPSSPVQTGSRNYFTGPSPSSNVSPVSQPFSYGPPVQNVTRSYLAPHAYPNPTFQAQPAQATRAPAHSNQQMPMGQQNPVFYQRWQQGDN